MKAEQPLQAGSVPSPLVSAVQIVVRRRVGLHNPAQMPRIERRVDGAQLNTAWLRQYVGCIGADIEQLHTHGLPPLTLQIAAAPLHLAILADARFPFRPLGLVHLDQTVEQFRRIDPAARLDLRAATADARTEKRGISFGLVTEAHADGHLVWRSTLRALYIHRPPEKKDRAATSADTRPAVPPPLDVHRIAVPEGMGRRYARIAGDRNPIHQHALLARPFGFRRAIVHGTWTLARALTSAGLPRSEVYRLQARFQRPVELPAEIVVERYAGKQPGHSVLRVAQVAGTKTHVSIDVNESLAAGRVVAQGDL